MPKQRRVSRGSATVEFALILPALLLIMMGMFTVGNYLTTRYHLTAAANQAARACSYPDSQIPNRLVCVQQEVGNRTPDYVRRRCPLLQPDPTIRDLPDVPVQVLHVQITCGYQPAIGGAFMAQVGIAFPPLITQGAMPLNL